MKKFKTNLDNRIIKMEKHWRTLPLEKQQQYILFLFVCYLLISVGVFFKIWYDVLQPSTPLAIEHINNPVIKKKESGMQVQDSVSEILKQKLYELK